MSHQTIDPANYISEHDVVLRWPMLTEKELRKARKKQLIEFYAFRHGPCYTAEQVQSYIDRTYLKVSTCVEPGQPPNPQRQPPSPSPTNHSKSEGSISTDRIRPAEDSSTHASMTPDLALSAANRLAQRIGKRPRSNSLPSSFPRRPQKTAPYLAPIKS